MTNDDQCAHDRPAYARHRAARGAYRVYGGMARGMKSAEKSGGKSGNVMGLQQNGGDQLFPYIPLLLMIIILNSSDSVPHYI